MVRSCLLCAVLDEQKKRRGAWITELYQNEGEWGKWVLQLGRFGRRYLLCSVDHALGPVTESYTKTDAQTNKSQKARATGAGGRADNRAVQV